MPFTPDQIAHVCHEANRAIQIITGDPAVSPHWDDAPQDQKRSATEGIQTAIDGATPEEQHAAWRAGKTADGWIYGPVKDPAAKTHPCLVAYADLPDGQKAKDAVYVAIVRALTGPKASRGEPTMTRDQIPGWEGTTGPFPGQYSNPHVYARDVHSGAGNCICGRPLRSTLHAQAAPGVDIPPELPDDPGDISDGHHTFNELYQHRAALFAALCRSHPGLSWRSRNHHEGGDPMFPGFFIAGITIPRGDRSVQVTYHCDASTWGWFDGAPVLDHAPAWDGHTPTDVVDRLNAWKTRGEDDASA
jgi:hypothetical protein